MKIKPLIITPTLTSAVQEKSEKGEFSDHSSRQQQQENRKKNDAKEIEVTESTIASAIESFTSDKHAIQNGLQASMEGQGPGLKVVLKDGTGSVVRQLTGEEFLKLRETVSKEGRGSGKILDQKL